MDISTADSYSPMVVITRMYWKEQDAIDYLQSSMLSHLYHFLQIADDAGILMTHDNYYNFNLFHTSSRNSPILRISTRISVNTIDM